MSIKRNKRGLLKRIHSIIKMSNDLNLQLDWDRNKNDYTMTILDVSNNVKFSQEIIGLKNKTEALHSGFDYFEKMMWEIKEKIGY